MTSQNTSTAMRAYLRTVADTQATGHATEQSYRPALQTLIEALGGDGTRALNEPSHAECGAPDFIVEHSGVPMGHIECKDVGANLDATEKSEQLKRYREGLPNLILTDYLEFRWYADGELRESGRLGRLNGRDGVALDSAGARQVAALLGLFFTADIPSIGNARDLAKRMAAKARLLRDGIDRILDQEGITGPLHDLLNGAGRVFINRDQYFEGVAPETWELTIGGYRPAEKWLKDRRHRTLSYEDITHYRRICAVLAETPRVMARIDEAIESHGGWPLG